MISSLLSSRSFACTNRAYLSRQYVKRNFTKFSGSSTSWGRMVTKIKETSSQDKPKPADYMEKVLEKHDPEAAVLQLQDEVQEEMAAALGRSGLKLRSAMKRMLKAKIKLDKYALQPDRKLETLQEYGSEYNELRKSALHARWELQIHRQAVGFVFQNHLVMEKTFPIPPPYRDEEEKET